MRRLFGASLCAVTGLMFLLSSSAGAAETPPAQWWGAASGSGIAAANPTPDDFTGHVIQIATSNTSWYALRDNGSVYAWGSGSTGELGDGQTINTAKPHKVKFPNGVQIAFLAANSPEGSALAVDTTGRAWGWGANRFGELCRAGQQDVPVQLPFAHATAIAGAGDHTVVVNDGAVQECGGNEHGDLGDGNTTPSSTPITLPLAGITSVYASWRNTGAETATGQYYDWGYGALGGNGNGTTADALTPYAVPLPGPVTNVSLGGSLPANGQTLALVGGTMYAWGSDQWGQLADGHTANVLSPEAVSIPETFTTVVSGGYTDYGITAAGKLYGWGDNSADQLTAANPKNDPAPVLLGTGIGEAAATFDTFEDLG